MIINSLHFNISTVQHLLSDPVFFGDTSNFAMSNLQVYSQPQVKKQLFPEDKHQVSMKKKARPMQHTIEDEKVKINLSKSVSNNAGHIDDDDNAEHADMNADDDDQHAGLSHPNNVAQAGHDDETTLPIVDEESLNTLLENKTYVVAHTFEIHEAGTSNVLILIF